MRCMNNILTILCSLLWVFPVLAVADDAAAYRKGLTAFKNGNYPAALQHFQKAELAGMSSVTLHYNLGATHFRLGNYQESRTRFNGIRKDKKWGALAEYNLGLIAERESDLTVAAHHYRQAYDKANSEKVRQLAQTRLNAISGSTAVPRSGDWSAFLSAALGNDDNPALEQDTLDTPDSDADSFVETIGNLSTYLRGNRRDGLRLSGGFYSREYSEFSQFSVSGVDLGLLLDDQTTNWQFLRGIRGANFWLDGNQYSTGGNLIAQAIQRNRGVRWNIKNDLGFIQGGSDFDFIDGIRNRLSLELFKRQSDGEWRIGYRNEYNDRDDLAGVDNQFFGYSPMRHSVYGQLRRSLGERWSLQARVEYRRSQYPDSNREIDVETTLMTETRRDEDRTDLSTLLRYSPNKVLSIFAEYRYSNNDSNLDRFAYKSNQVMLGLDAILARN